MARICRQLHIKELLFQSPCYAMCGHQKWLRKSSWLVCLLSSLVFVFSIHLRPMIFDDQRSFALYASHITLHRFHITHGWSMCRFQPYVAASLGMPAIGYMEPLQCTTISSRTPEPWPTSTTARIRAWFHFKVSQAPIVLTPNTTLHRIKLIIIMST